MTFIRVQLLLGISRDFLQIILLRPFMKPLWNFHNTVDRFAKFKAAVEADSEGRATSVQEEIKFVLDREELAHTLCDLQDTGKNASSCNSQ